MLVVTGFFILTFTGGVFSATEPEKCKDEESCLKHEYFTKNNPICVRTCANRLDPVKINCDPYTGCACEEGYVRKYEDGTGPCIRETKCATNRICPKYERYARNSVGCPKTCGNRRVPASDVAGTCPPKKGCICDAGYVRKYDNATGPCIRVSECPKIPNNCGVNEIPTSCDIKCPPQTCDSLYSIYDCPETECEPGCICRDNYLRNSDNVCILSEECIESEPLICGPNEVASQCAITCPPQSCDSIFTDYLCANEKCSPGCNCVDGYLRNSEGKCIPSEQCFNDGAGCRGDANATQVACGSACEATCAQPNTDRPCILLCRVNACKCNSGFILTEPNGICVRPEDCPGGNPTCGANKTYVNCNVGCPNNYCPRDDGRGIVACDPPYPCPGGCACNSGYLILSDEDKQCVLSSECPPVNCTRPNEVWDPNPTKCFDERCGSKCENNGQTAPRCVCKDGFFRNDSDICVPESECPTQACNGDPNASFSSCLSSCPKTCSNKDKVLICPAVCSGTGCKCNPGYVLNDDGLCVKPEECPASEGCNGDPNAEFSDCITACPRTCENQEDDPFCPVSCDRGGCVCKPGFVLNTNGSCIKPEECTGPRGCNGDPNAQFSECPSACPLTCNNKEIINTCAPACERAGCECKPGFVLNDSGLCIKPKECPGGSPRCAGNQTYVDCTACATDYCPTSGSRGFLACSIAYPCPGGCVCTNGYSVISYEDPRCILTSDCPSPDSKTKCSKPNEIWDENPSACYPEKCENRDGACDDSIKKIRVFPRCVCAEGYYRNKDNDCVPESECPPIGCNGDPNAMFSGCLTGCPRTCEDQEDDEKCPVSCDSGGCVCKPGFVLNPSGSCIKPEQCTGPRGCKGDPNAKFSDCPSPCPVSCDNKEQNASCSGCGPAGCECKPNYVLNSDGRCVKPKDCPGGLPTCPANQTYVDCTACASDNCATLDIRGQFACSIAYPCPGGCVCSSGYASLSYEDQRCVLASDCPPSSKCPKPNEIWDENPSACYPEKCENRDGACDELIRNITVFPRCVCVEGYYRNQDNDCVPESECPPIACNGDPNAMFSGCLTGCPRTCEDQEDDEKCPVSCDSGGCVCKPGFVLSPSGSCIKPEQCTGPRGCNGDPNAKFSDCPSVCPVSCDNKEQNATCSGCGPAGCECKPNYVLNSDGRCVKPNDCPGGSPTCPANQTYVDCTVCASDDCATLDIRGQFACSIAYPCPGGCVCSSGYATLSSEDQRCVLISECPPVTCTRPNEVWDPKPTRCYRETCEDRDNKECYVAADNPRCVCKEGYYRNVENVCVPESECPPLGCNGDVNSTFSFCLSGCPETCSNKDEEILCTDDCKGTGCACKSGYVLNDAGLCIKPEDCPGSPTCSANQTYVDCTTCATNYCPIDDNRGLVSCAIAYPCPSGCVCKSGYLAKSYEDNQCILASECPPVQCTRPNEEWNPNPSDCYSEKCSDTDGECEYVANDKPRCVCKEGYLRNDDQICIPKSQCPPGCNGDRNATFNSCLSACPITCANQNEAFGCIDVCKTGCDCNLGYVLNQDTGLCVKPTDCPGGKPTCGVNETYVDCLGCSTNYCPTSDSRGIVECSIAYPCPGGCTCSNGYLALSAEDKRCVLASECPPVQCTRPNEVWDPKPSKCYSEKCDDRESFCLYTGPDKPRCVCLEGYYRNEDDICVPQAECPPIGCGGDQNATFRGCLSPCRTTCANRDQSFGCPAVCSGAGCDCNPGYVYNEFNKCIKPEDCPADPKCNGDRNATFQFCPSSCRASCDNPEQSGACSEVCAPEGCGCKNGYILLPETGQCVAPIDCPGGIPKCPANESYQFCKISCLTDYCPANDSLTSFSCNYVFPCRGGCVCEEGYLRLSNENPQCVPSAECPPVECTRPNEIWDPNPSGCLRERCEEMDSDCDIPILPYPKCVCEPGYFRNASDICVPAAECPSNGCKGDLNASYRDCLSACPTTCANKDLNIECIEVCMPAGCACNDGYVMLSDTNDVCIKIEDCPAESQCGGDRNATFKTCPSPCHATCDNPESFRICPDVCDPDGCVCKPGYLLTQEEDGKCVDPSDCPGGSPTCPANEEYVDCKVLCPSNYCPTIFDDSSSLVICDPIFPCPGGCVCKEGYLRFNETDDRCVPVSECPQLECTKPNEVWEPNPPKCLRERCDSRNLDCDFQIQQPPRCICKPGYFRNQDDVCVLASECSAPQPKCGLNEVSVPCRTICPPQNCEIAYTDYACTEETKICEPGCDCLPNHLRNGSGICVPNEECPYPSTPVCGINEIARDCKTLCPPQTCLSKYALFRCIDEIPCEPGCDCVANYLRDENGKCVPSEKCPPLPPACSVSDECKRTCASPNPPNCPYLPPEENIDGCNCKMGYVLSTSGGVCVKIEECPSELACNGDQNARPKQCPLPCPSTCESPDAVPCKKMCDPIGCECKPGFILSNITGQCILPNQCPGGNPCGESGRFVYCKSECPQDYCPTDDSRGIIACDPSPECLSGCICDLNHKRKSIDDPTCVVSSDCPPVQCTRPNEEWSGCPSACLQERCEDIHNQPIQCNTLVLNCQPSCVCKKDHFRNATDICIPAKDCPC